MDSGNSGSLQSSSGGDEEFDSRAIDSFSSFLGRRVGPISNSTPPPPLFDPLSNYLQNHQPNSSSLLLNPNIYPPRSDPNHPSPNQNLLSSSPTFMTTSFKTSGSNSTAIQQSQSQPAVRNPKKRSRASRRAPTTVLTTDTTNFRAMVQEFTGIPAPPFNNSPFQRTRLDLFGQSSPYLRRPFAQKVHSPPPPPFLDSSALDAITASSSSTTNNNNINITSSVPSSGAANSSFPQLPITQSSNLFNIPSPLLTSLLQTNPKFPFSSSPSPLGNNNPSNNEFGLGHGNNLSGLPSLIPSDQNVNAGEGDQRPVNNGGSSYNFSRNGSGFNGEKVPESNVNAARGEGMVESWICSSE